MQGRAIIAASLKYLFALGTLFSPIEFPITVASASLNPMENINMKIAKVKRMTMMACSLTPM
jgi:hypothetical protein